MVKFDSTSPLSNPEMVKTFLNALDKKTRPDVISSILKGLSLDKETKFALLRVAIQNDMIAEVVQPMHMMSSPLASFGAKLKPEQLILIVQDCLELIRNADQKDRDKHEAALSNMFGVVDLLKNVDGRDISKMLAILSPDDQKDLFLLIGSRCLGASMVGDDGKYTSDFIYMGAPPGFIGKFVGAYKDLNLDVILGDDVKLADRQFAVAFTALAACQNNKLDPDRISLDFAESVSDLYSNRDKTGYMDLTKCGELLDTIQNPARRWRFRVSDVVTKISELSKELIEHIKSGASTFTSRITQSRAEDNTPGRS